MTNSVGLTFADLREFFAFGCLIGTVAFGVATKLKEAEIKSMKSETLKEVGETIDKFRTEIKGDLHYFRAETDDGIRQFEINVQKSLANYKVKQGILESVNNEIVNFLTIKFNFKRRRELANDSLPTDFTSPKSEDN